MKTDDRHVPWKWKWNQERINAGGGTTHTGDDKQRTRRESNLEMSQASRANPKSKAARHSLSRQPYGASIPCVLPTAGAKGNNVRQRPKCDSETSNSKFSVLPYTWKPEMETATGEERHGFALNFVEFRGIWCLPTAAACLAARSPQRHPPSNPTTYPNFLLLHGTEAPPDSRALSPEARW